MRILLFGFSVGVMVPIIGLIIALFVSSSVGDILLFPVHILSTIFDEPFWFLSFEQRGVLFILCGLMYACFIAVLDFGARRN